MTYHTINSFKEKVASNGHQSLTTKFDIDDDNLSFRRKFIRLGEEERALCIDLIPWIKEHASKIVREFFDFQFGFEPTLAFFKRIALEQGISVSDLRTQLEQTQYEYLVSCFEGASDNWGVDYYETRMLIGETNHRINLPYKWYIGAYSELQRLVNTYLANSFDDSEYIQRVSWAVSRIFYYDMQAVIDAAIFTEFESFGFPFETIQTSYETDRTDHVDEIKKYVARKRLDAASSQGQLEAIAKIQGVVELDMEGNILSANQLYLNALGYALEDVIGQNNVKIIGGDGAQNYEYIELWRQLKEGKAQLGEYQEIDKHGHVVWFYASYTPLLDNNGTPFKVVKYAREITEEVEARARLEQCVSEILDVVNAASTGDLTREVTVSGEDAIGQMGAGIRGFLSKFKEVISSIDENAQLLSAAADELSAVSDNMGHTAGQTSQQATSVASSAEEVSSNIQTVAAGAEEMSASIKEVASNAGEAARVAAEAVDAAETTNITVSKLGESSAEIGNVIKVITSIAQQTNLLALNATIEAARAGEAGKGFAVVANEVKELAKQTAQATEEISQKIEAIQSDTKGAVDAITKISLIIGQINDIQGTIAAAVEEQTSTTTEIARNVHEAAKGSSEIAESISHVAMAADETSSGARESKTATQELAKMSSALQGIVALFKY